ncbi:MAG: hypothetical protein COT74_06285 [Bdellovibrionales bacterium CG10_big_fil_rev_8_21_14_0_10_45_34]|nr:MAG: hypothetical protein COT74_06285 [Bdellovibrionales bacterium CG10_big_fil_rev_8_21_14_0_10_45_34]
MLIGPRQTGKSTFIRQLKPDLEINLARQLVYLDFLSNPGLLESEVHSRVASGERLSVFIDEVQRLPSLLNTVQSLIDENPKLRFYLTSSSARKLKRGNANLLPGRIVSYEMRPLSIEELGDQFDLKKALIRGLLPGIYLDSSDVVWRKVLRTYAVTYLQEEVQAEALTRNLEGFSRFFSVVASRNAELFDIAKFSSEAQIERTTAKRYFEILEYTLILNRIEAFAKSTRRRIIQHPRFYFFDVGALNGSLGNFNVSDDRKGKLLENLVLQLLLSSFKGQDRQVRVSHYRTDAGAEVDFIVQTESKVFAIEVKSARAVAQSELSGLKSFAGFYDKPHRAMVLCLAERQQLVDGIEIWPLKEGILQITKR